ncbi:MAG: hypothetical protein HKN87_20395 [Saprospiraceae bacterium]|nr:hypothetical protein [Saprospiraceae bacterium]
MISRRQFVVNSALTLGAWASSGASFGSQQLSEDLDWYNVEDWGIEGKGWTDTFRYYDRFPKHAKQTVREAVWNLSRHSAGMMTRFRTDAKEVHVRYTLHSERLAMAHMPATGVSGMDLYAEDVTGHSRWVGVSRPVLEETEYKLVDDLSGLSYLFSIYLPLYNGVESLEIGVPKDTVFAPIQPRTAKPVVFYGTSILHGACASRPGMAFTNILGRRLKVPTMNLGFSGNGRMEPEVASLLAELDARTFVIDCLPNLGPDQVQERAEPFVKILRAKHSSTPILLVEDRSNTNALFKPSRFKHHQDNRKALRETYERLQDQDIPNIYYLSGENLLGTDGEGATDGSHPNDLGMMRYADAYEPALRNILQIY